MKKPVLLTTIALVALSATLTWAQPAGQGGGFQQAGPASPASMTGRFESGCAICHDNPATPNLQAPTRQALREFTPERVLAALTTGSMAVHAERMRLNDDQKRALAELVTGKPFGGTANRTAESMKNRCEAPLTLDNPFARPNWNGWNPDTSTSYRFMPAETAGLTAERAPQLKLKWAFAFPDSASAAWSQPTVVGGALFMGTDNNFVYAIDTKSGCVHWSYDAKAQVRGAVSIAEVKDLQGVRYGAYFGDMTGVVHGVNAETGKELWTMRADPHPGAKITAALALDPSGGRLLVPVASWEEQTGSLVEYECCKFQGSIVAVDVKSGKQLWKSYSMAERPQPLAKKNSLGKQLYGPAGASIWNTPTVDVKRRAVYAGTGNCYITEHFGAKFGYDGGACDAVVAFDLDSGKRLWTTQLLAWDPDEGGCGRGPERRVNCPGYVQGPGDDVNATLLFTQPNGRRVLIASQESGRITGLDPDAKGAILWVVQAGDQMSPNASAPWGGASDGALYFRPLSFGDQTGAMAALRPTTGERAWYIPLPKPSDCPDPNSRQTCHSGNNAGATAIPGAVFTGSRDGVMRAYAVADGKILWEFSTNRTFDTVNGVAAKSGSIGGPGPTIVDGMLFMGSGYSIVGGAPGNLLLAFGVDSAPTSK